MAEDSQFASLPAAQQEVVRNAILQLAGFNIQTGGRLEQRDERYNQGVMQVARGEVSFETLADSFLKENPQFSGGVTHNAHASVDVQAPTTPNHAQSQSSGAVLA